MSSAGKKYLTDCNYRRKISGLHNLYPIQVDVLNDIQKALITHNKKIITLYSARQTTKNEVVGESGRYALFAYQKRGGNYIHTGLTGDQLVNSKLRIEKFVKADPLLGYHNKKISWKERHFLFFKKASIQTMALFDQSKQAQATGQTKKVGATASIGIAIDEAHLVNKDIFESTVLPMASQTGAPTILYGIMSMGTDILYQNTCQILDREPDSSEFIDGKNGVWMLPAWKWCEFYGKDHEWTQHYLWLRDKLGQDSDFIKMNYDLIKVDSLEGFLSKKQIDILLDSNFERQEIPKKDKDYMILADIAGGDEISIDRAKTSDSTRDYSAFWIVEVDYSDIVNDYPMCRLVNLSLYRNLDLTTQQNVLLSLFDKWQPMKSIIDARGIGEQIATFIQRRFPCEVYKATSDSIDWDLSYTKGMINNNRIKIFRNDNSRDYKELVAQLKQTQKKINSSGKITLSKPTATAKIDILKALTYLPRCAIQGVQYR